MLLIRFYVSGLLIIFALQHGVAANERDALGKGQSAADPTVMVKQNSVLEWQLTASRAGLVNVIDTLMKSTGIAIHYSMLPDDLVSVACQGDLKRILMCLLGSRVDMVLRERVLNRFNRSFMSQPEEVWLLPRALPAPQTTAGQPVSGNNTEQAQVDKKNRETVDHTDYFLAQLQDPSQRVEGIAKLAVLGRKNDMRVRAVLKQALVDENPAVRAQAIFALARHEGNEAIADNQQQALSDENVEVRRMAIEHCGDDRLLLQQALNDTDASIRRYAKTKLALLDNNENKY